MNPHERPASRAHAGTQTRSVEVALSSTLTFHLTEVLFQPRPAHWARVWPASMAVARWLLARGPLPRRARELGCGMGLVSLALAHLGVDVQATDRQPLALEYAAHNAARNGQRPLDTALLDWDNPTGHAVPLLVGADILYEPRAPSLLHALVHDAGLLLPGGMLVLGVPSSRAGHGLQLAATLVQRGYAHELECMDVCLAGECHAVDIHVLHRRAG